MTTQATAITQALLEILSESTLPMKRCVLITKVYQKTRELLDTNHLTHLIGNGKIQRTGIGFYQLSKKQLP